MVTANAFHHNGTNGHVLYCPSDHEPIDVTPTAPKPAWRDEFPTFTHHLQWVDADSVSHGLTLRSDSLQDLMSDLRMVKGMIRQAKQKAAESKPQSEQTPEPDSDVPPCKVHGAPMRRAVSKRTGGTYFYHDIGRDRCFGRAAKA
jgi:hypothetical protein